MVDQTDIPHTTAHHTANHHKYLEYNAVAQLSCMKTFSWTAVIVGALVGIGITFLLNLFSIAIGLSAFHLNTAGVATLATGGIIGLAIGTIVAMSTAGWIAGYLGRAHCFKRNLGALYGFTAWSIALLMMVLAARDIGSYLTSYAAFVSRPVLVTANANTASALPAKVNVNDTTAANVNVKTIPTSSSNAVMLNNQKIDGNLALSVAVIFSLFFLGALSSAIGGHIGMSYRCKEQYCDIEPTNLNK